MTTLYLLNSLSASMLPADQGILGYRVVTQDEARELAQGGFVSAVGHDDAAKALGDALGVKVTRSRIHVELAPGCRAIVGQCWQKRRPEGAKGMPPGPPNIRWVLVEVFPG